MTLDIDDLLDGEAETTEQAESVEPADQPGIDAATADAELDVMQDSAEFAALQQIIAEDAARPGMMTYDLETVPDESRFPPPEGSTPPGLSLPIADLLRKSIPDVKQGLEQATDDELLQIFQAEKELDKPRKGVVDAIDDLRNSRATRFADWVKKHSVDPFTCRICCLGWSVGVGEIRAMTAKNDDEERRLLTAFWTLCHKERIRVGFGITRFDDMVILNRSVRLGIPVPRRLDVKKYSNQEARDLENIIFINSQVQKCKTVARAWGINIPVPEMDGSKVYDLFQAGEMQKIADYCRSDVSVERDMFVIASRLFA